MSRRRGEGRGNGGSQPTDFQQATADLVVERFFDRSSTASGRFLVADEVGLGKTLVAREVIRQTIERLRENDSGVDRIDVIYVCANAGIAQQNIAKLGIPGVVGSTLSTRISMLALQPIDLARKSDPGDVTPVNLIAFTPGTSFNRGYATGLAEERALLAHFTAPLFRTPVRRNAVWRLFQGAKNTPAWKLMRKSFESDAGPNGKEPQKRIGRSYRALLRGEGAEVHRRLVDLVDRVNGQGVVADGYVAEAKPIISDLRHLLARASVESLEPDLIILDEFQRFRHLLSAPAGDDDQTTRLAQALFDYEGAKVLLLSATPYKLFTIPEDRAHSGDDHYRDFIDTFGFLVRNESEAIDGLAEDLAAFRAAMMDLAHSDPTPARDRMQARLRQVMCRTERPTVGDDALFVERVGGVESPTATDFLAFASSRKLAQAVDAPMSVEYWKSAPYFVNFMSGYQVAGKVARVVDRDLEVNRLAKSTPRIKRSQVDQGKRIDPGNARLRALEEEVLTGSMPNLLWLPPSLPYSVPAGGFADVDPTVSTKRLIFSSWSAAPSAIAALLSHEARRLRGTFGKPVSERLKFSVREGRPGSMTTLLLSVPSPGLAALADPRELVRSAAPGSVTGSDLVRKAIERISPGIDNLRLSAGSTEEWYWRAVLRWPGCIDGYIDLANVLTVEDAGPGEGQRGLKAHLGLADQPSASNRPGGSAVRPGDLADTATLVALASPANCAWRALRRVVPPDMGINDRVFIEAATIIAAGFRSLFNRSDVIQVVSRTASNEAGYWRDVLQYCLDGNLQAVLDEYLHHEVGQTSLESAGDRGQALKDLAAAVRDVIRLGSGRIDAYNPMVGDDHEAGRTFPIRPGFAQRYGTARGTLAKDEKGVARAGDVQKAFNSPFWPFVLASTSVGQEGIDFHWWCHSLVHWNLPANVVDLEQREGRVHRYRGHAVRKNVAAEHGAAALASDSADPWRTAFELAAEGRPEGMNDLWPSWVYPGPAKVEAWVPYLPLSREIGRLERLRRDRALYRLAFGQPRQEDLLAILAGQGIDQETLDRLRIDLSPPRMV